MEWEPEENVVKGRKRRGTLRIQRQNKSERDREGKSEGGSSVPPRTEPMTSSQCARKLFTRLVK
jgi:hypothetical protein